jgi:hypothetical protein
MLKLLIIVLIDISAGKRRRNELKYSMVFRARGSICAVLVICNFEEILKGIHYTSLVCRTEERGITIEIIDIECVLLSFLSKNFVSTKWRIYMGILASPRLLRQRISRGCRECELFFSTEFAKKIISRLKVEKNVF